MGEDRPEMKAGIRKQEAEMTWSRWKMGSNGVIPQQERGRREKVGWGEVRLRLENLGT